MDTKRNTSVPNIFARALYVQRREDAERKARNSFLLDEVAENLRERVSAVNRSFGRALDLGSRSQSFARLRAAAETWIRAPVAPVVSSGPESVVIVDEECLPFAQAQFDLIVSALSLHAANDLPGVLTQIRQLLRPDGLFVAALFGGSTLWELRSAFAAAESETTAGASPRVAPFADVRALGNLLQRAGFALPVADLQRVNARYGSLFTLVEDLRDLGETNALTERSRLPLRRATLAALMDHYAKSHADSDGKFRATFDVIYVTAWA